MCPVQPAFTESALGEEEVQERAAAIFPEDTLAALCSANWKDRLAAVERMREVGGPLPPLPKGAPRKHSFGLRRNAAYPLAY